MFVFCFPPFSLVLRVMRKINRDKTIVVAPDWPGQLWHPLLQLEARGEVAYPRQLGNLLGAKNLKGESQNQGLEETKLKVYLF